MTVAIAGFYVDAVFGTWNLTGKPSPHRRHRQKGGSMLESNPDTDRVPGAFLRRVRHRGDAVRPPTLTDRTRNAVRWGAVNTFAATSIKNLVLYGATSPAQGQTPAFDLTALNITIWRPTASVGQPEDRVIVTVIYPVSLISLCFGQSANWSGTSVP